MNQHEEYWRLLAEKAERQIKADGLALALLATMLEVSDKPNINGTWEHIADAISRLRAIKNAVMDCEGIEMRDCYEVPKEAWEKLMLLTAKVSRAAHCNHKQRRLPASARP